MNHDLRLLSYPAVDVPLGGGVPLLERSHLEESLKHAHET